MDSSNPTHAMKQIPPTMSSGDRLETTLGTGTTTSQSSKAMSISLPHSDDQGPSSEYGPPATPSARDGDPSTNSSSSKSMSISPPHNDDQTESNNAAPNTPGPTPELADVYGSIIRNAKTPANSPAAASDAGTSLEFARGDTGSPTARGVAEADTGEGEMTRSKKRVAEDDVNLSGERKRSKDGNGRAGGADENGSRRLKFLEKKDSDGSLSYGRSASEAVYVPDPREWMDESETTAAVEEEWFGVDELGSLQSVDEGGSVEVTGKASAEGEGTAYADLLKKSPKKTGGAQGAEGSEEVEDSAERGR